MITPSFAPTATERVLPRLALDFTAGALDSRVTFSRASNATLTDATGKITYAPNNVQTYSQSLSNLSGGQATVTDNQASAPDGTTTAGLLKTTASSGESYWNGLNVSSGKTVYYMFSAYVKYIDCKYFGFGLYDGTHGNNYVSWNVLTGAFNSYAGTGGHWSNAAISDEGDGWYRVSAIFSGTGAGGNAKLVLSSTSTINSNGTSGVGVYVWGWQIEAVTYQTTPGDYHATTSAAYYGPRFDYDPVTLAPNGLLIEEQRTNLLTYSEQFDNAVWVKGNSTVSANVIASPNGSVDADKLVENTATNSHVVQINSQPVSNATSYAFSVYAKAAERNWLALGTVGFGTGYTYFNLATGAIGTVLAGHSASITPVGNGWYRCTIVATSTTTSASLFIGAASADGGAIYPGDGTSGIYIWGAQLEAGAFATSYIPTTTTSLTRNADLVSMTGTNFSSWYNQPEGAFSVEALPNTLSGLRRILVASDGTPAASRVVDMYISSGSFASYNGSTPITTANSVSSTTSPMKGCAAYKANSYALCLNAGTVATQSSATVNTPNTLYIGAFGVSSDWFNGCLRKISYWPQRIINAETQAFSE